MKFNMAGSLLAGIAVSQAHIVSGDWRVGLIVFLALAAVRCWTWEVSAKR